jgi:hypothetical protein
MVVHQVALAIERRGRDSTISVVCGKLDGTHTVTRACRTGVASL